MSDSNQLVEKRAKLAAKQKELAEVFEIAKDGDRYDLSRKAALDKLGATDANDAIAKIKERSVELDNIGAELQHAELLEAKSGIEQREAAMRMPVRGGEARHPVDVKARTFGEMAVNNKSLKEAIASKAFMANEHLSINVELPDLDLKTLMSTTAGFAPESVRSGLLVEAVTRPIGVLDMIPVHAISQAVDKYMAETTRTHAAAETAEGATYKESTFVWAEQTSPVRKITDSIPVTDEQLEDEGQVSALLDSRLRFGIRQRLDLQVLVGDGVAPNLMGILDDGRTIQTVAKGSDPAFDAVFKAMTKVRFTGRAMPSGLVFHPNDWQDVRLTRTADGQYIMGAPTAPGATTLFGLPVAITDAITEGTGLVGDFVNFCYIGERRGINVLVGYSGTQFTEGKKTIRADMRACFTVTREFAFCSITGL